MRSNKPAVIIGLAVLLSIPVHGAAGKKCLFIGNSLTDEVYGTQDIAESVGYTACSWGRHMTPGTPLWLLWQDESMKDVEYYPNNNQYGAVLAAPLTNRLRDTAWDVVTLQVYPMNGDGLTSSGISAVTAARGFAAAAYQGNPNCQIYIHESHPTFKDYPTPNAASNNPPYMTNDTNMYRPIADSLRHYFPSNPPALVVPANPVWHRMRQLVNAGNAPGLSSYLDLYAADSGHASANGRYLLATLFYATIYKQDPHGIMTSGFKHLGWTSGVAWSVTSTFGSTVWDVVWGTLQQYPYAGVNPTVSARPFTPGSSAVSVKRGRTVAGADFDLTGRRCSTSEFPVSVRIVDGRTVVTARSVR
jgi:hypothetical protein